MVQTIGSITTLRIDEILENHFVHLLSLNKELNSALCGFDITDVSNNNDIRCEFYFGFDNIIESDVLKYRKDITQILGINDEVYEEYVDEDNGLTIVYYLSLGINNSKLMTEADWYFENDYEDIDT